jgi:voltage-gated sodium channel
VSALDEETAADAPKLTHPAGIEERLLDEVMALRAEVAALREQGRAPIHKADL